MRWFDTKPMEGLDARLNSGAEGRSLGQKGESEPANNGSVELFRDHFSSKTPDHYSVAAESETRPRIIEARKISRWSKSR